MAHPEQTGKHDTKMGMKLRCPICGAEYQNEQELSQHKQKSHPNQ